jgi:peptide chain release factor
MATEFQREFPDAKVLSVVKGHKKDCFCSITLETEQDASSWAGTVAWICQSPFRPHHKRKNWYIHVSLLPDESQQEEDSGYKLEYFHCGGKGGQNVNKVETGVRLTHMASGLTVTATEERTQEANRRIAQKKLEALLASRQEETVAQHKNEARHEHYELVRGNPVRIYEGQRFQRKS